MQWYVARILKQTSLIYHYLCAYLSWTSEVRQRSPTRCIVVQTSLIPNVLEINKDLISSTLRWCYHIEAWIRWRRLCRRLFRMFFLEWNFMRLSCIISKPIIKATWARLLWIFRHNSLTSILNKLRWKSIQNTQIAIHENVFEHFVCHPVQREMSLR